MTDMIPRAEADAMVAAICVKGGHKMDMGHSYLAGNAIRALTPDDASAALEAMLADAEKRGEKRGLLRAAEIAEPWLDGQTLRLHAGEMTPQEHRSVVAVVKAIVAAIRAEAEE